MTSNASNQRNIFLRGEGDLWLSRNYRQHLPSFSDLFESDPLLPKLIDLPLPRGSQTSILEVGCGQGLRLEALKDKLGWCVNGLDPSKKAIAALQLKNISATVGTAENLPYDDNKFDLLVFGFCLYLCDRDDLFLIASEANRVLKKSGWIAIYDFWSPIASSNKYKHCEGVFSFKASMQTLFDWHPCYTVYDHSVRHHNDHLYTDETNEWVATTIIRKTFGS